VDQYHRAAGQQRRAHTLDDGTQVGFVQIVENLGKHD